MWVAGGKPVDAGFIHIMVDDAARTSTRIMEAGGAILQHPDPGAREVTALFQDPAGNILSIYEEKGLKKGE